MNLLQIYELFKFLRLCFRILFVWLNTNRLTIISLYYLFWAQWRSCNVSSYLDVQFQSLDLVNCESNIAIIRIFVDCTIFYIIKNAYDSKENLCFFLKKLFVAMYQNIKSFWKFLNVQFHKYMVALL